MVSFKFYEMNFVDFVIDCYLHITSHVSQVFASSCYCMCLWSDQPSLQLLWILCKIDLMFENFWRMQEILILGNLSFNSCFWKSYHHILIHLVPQCQCFELFLNVFSKTVFFLNFSEPLPVSIDPIYFSINRNSFKLSKEASVCFDWSKLFFDQSKLVNQVF